MTGTGAGTGTGTGDTYLYSYGRKRHLPMQSDPSRNFSRAYCGGFFEGEAEMERRVRRHNGDAARVERVLARMRRLPVCQRCVAGKRRGK